MTGAAALDQLASLRADLVVLDVLMPALDGITVCRWLRESGDRTPILMLTTATRSPTELLEQAGPLDVLVIPVGGGGQLAGAGVVCAAGHGTRLIGVETTAGDKNRRSLRAGHRVRIPVPRTIADGVTGKNPRRVDLPPHPPPRQEILVVDDNEISAAMAMLFEETKLVVEPSGALAAAAVLAGRVHAPGGRVGVVRSGGNIDLPRLNRLLYPGTGC